MITFLHSYYEPNDNFYKLETENLYWSHSGFWNKEWDNQFNCNNRFLTNNIGKDIGGKMFLFKVLLEENITDDYILFLHDKQSPQVLNGKKWNKELWNITSSENINKAINIMNKDNSIGIVANKQSIVNPDETGEKYAYATNKEIIFKQAEKYNILPSNKSFVAGTMFIARLQPYIDFFSKNNPINIRLNMEAGNVLDINKGTLTHSWERLLSWIITSKNYRIGNI